MRLRASWALTWLGFATGACADTFVAKVVAVVDGDTVMVVQGNHKTTLRLAGIDAPERAQPWGSESRGALAMLVLRKAVRVTTKAVDDYGRVVAVLEVGGSGGDARVNVNEAQLRSGMAWAYTAFRADKTLVALQTEAQRARLGLWQQRNPVPPWTHRKNNVPAPVPQAKSTACGSKRYCAQMVSCEEATFYLEQCNAKALDRNGDGVPCEQLCKAKEK